MKYKNLHFWIQNAPSQNSQLIFTISGLGGAENTALVRSRSPLDSEELTGNPSTPETTKMKANLILNRTGWALSCLLAVAACNTTTTDRGESSPRATGAHSISIEEASDVGRTGQQVVYVATVKDAAGTPVPHVRVEWLLAQGSVGSILDIDRQGSSSAHQHFSSNYAVTATNAGDRERAGEGQTWCSVISPTEGTLHLIAYCPDIQDAARQQAFATKAFRDVSVAMPKAATNRVGTDQPLSVKVTRQSDGTPLAGQEVTFQVVDGPRATFAPGGGSTVTVKTDANGMAGTTLKQVQPATGANKVAIRVVRPANEKCCEPAALLAEDTVIYSWVAPSINIAKVGPARAVVGDEFQYDIQVKAGTGISARGVTVTDTLPAGIRYVRSTPPATVRGQSLSWNLGDLAQNGSKKVQVTVTAERTGKFTNCAEVKAEGGSLSDKDCADTVVTAPKLALSLTGPAEVLKCDPIEYKLTVSNGGDAPATNVKISDTLPNGLVTADSKNAVNYTVASLPAGQSKSFTFKASALRGGEFTNRATATADGGLKSEASAKTVVRQPVLKVAKSGPEKRFVGRPVVFDVTVTNTGDGLARDTVLTDRLPAGTEFRSASDGGRLVEGVVTWNLGNLAPKASKKVRLTVMTSQSGVVRNTATAKAYCADAVSDSAETRVEGIPAILLEVVDVEDPVEVGTNTKYVITVTNQGSAPASNIRITLTLPRQIQYVSSDGPTTARSTANQLSFAPLATLAPKAKATFEVTVKAVGEGDIRTKVSMVSDQSSVPVEETESTYLYQ
ncbi:MAG: DUF11 domain-containing protein [Planctomycetota bacterium]|nr:MAG: DUF11 domain-containing protein [Planctomycetota bacterium]